MHSMTLEQLRTASESGGVSDVTLKGQGSTFLIHIATRSGTGAVLAKARSSEPRRFASIAAALNVLRDVGITIGKFDAREWDPSEREPAKRTENRGQALRKAHEAAAYNEWLAAEIQEAVEDSRPSIPHDEVRSRMDARIAHHMAANKKRPG